VDRLGTFALALGLGLAVYGAVASVLGARRERPLLVESARTTAYSLLAVVAAANGAMLAAILSNDFSIKYVAENSSRATPTFFKVLSLWSADEGSLLLWNLVLAGFIVAVAFRFRHRRPETFPWAMAVMYGVAAFYLILVLGPTNPFATFATAPEPGDKLMSFYRRVRPSAALWKPIAAMCPDVPPSHDAAWNFLDWICGCVMIYSSLFGIGKIILKETGPGLMFLAAAAFAGGIIYWDLSRRGWSTILE